MAWGKKKKSALESALELTVKYGPAIVAGLAWMKARAAEKASRNAVEWVEWAKVQEKVEG